ncbi:MAG: hypothetical protein ABSG25_09025 [Bryobacteraceae bacterium]
MNVEDIAKQLSESKPVNITTQGEIVRYEDTVDTPEGPVDRNSGQPVTTLKPQRWYAWFNSNPARLVDEKESMQVRFGGFRLYSLPVGLAWDGWLRPKQSTKNYRVSVVYPDDFPYHPPKVFVIDPKISVSKHQYGDGSLCLMYPGDGTWQTNTTAVQAVAMAAAWLFCYEYHARHCGCDITPCDFWPGTEAAHG